MTDIMQVTVMAQIPLYSSAASRPMAVSLPAPPWHLQPVQPQPKAVLPAPQPEPPRPTPPAPAKPDNVSPTVLQQWAKLAEIENIRMRAALGINPKASEAAKITGKLGGDAIKVNQSRPEKNAETMLPVIIANPGITRDELIEKSGLTLRKVDTGRKVLLAEGNITVTYGVGIASRYWPVDGQLADGCTQTAKNTDTPATGQKTGGRE